MIVSKSSEIWLIISFCEALNARFLLTFDWYSVPNYLPTYQPAQGLLKTEWRAGRFGASD